MFPPWHGACGDQPICTALPGWSAGAGSRELPLHDPPVMNVSSAATQSMSIACDAGRGVVDAVAASSAKGRPGRGAPSSWRALAGPSDVREQSSGGEGALDRLRADGGRVVGDAYAGVCRRRELQFLPVRTGDVRGWWLDR